MINQGSGLLRELIRILVRDLGILEKSDASCSGISLAQCHAIVEIGRKEKISLVDLSGLLGLDKSTMSRTINNLVESDLENRRYVIIQLTEKGKRVFKDIEDSMETYYRDIFNAIPESKRYQVLESLALLKEAVEGSR